MNVPISDAKAVLADLVRRAEAGEEVVLTRHGAPVARIIGAAGTAPQDPAARLEFLRAISAAGRAKASPGPSAERSADFLYDRTGLPG